MSSLPPPPFPDKKCLTVQPFQKTGRLLTCPEWSGYLHPFFTLVFSDPSVQIPWPNSPPVTHTFSFSIMSLLRTTHILPFKTLAVLNRQATSFLFLPLTSLPLTHCHLLCSSFLLHLFTSHWSLSPLFICLWFPCIVHSSIQYHYSHCLSCPSAVHYCSFPRKSGHYDIELNHSLC